MIDLCLVNCKIMPENMICCIGIEKGKIFTIKRTPIKSEKTIDIKENIILPGLIDAHVHLRDPGLTQKEDFRTGTMAAACGGFTTVLDMPNTIPATTTYKAFKDKLKIAERKSIVDFGLHAGVDDLKHVKKLAELKPASFKIYMDLVDNEFLREIFAVISEIGKNLITLHAEDRETIENCTREEKVKNGLDAEVYALARPPSAEEIAVSNALSLAKDLDLSLHICHISTGKSLEIINQAKYEGYNVTSEVTPHHLFLDSEYLKKMGNFAKTNPSLRDKRHKIEITDLEQIDIMATDHAPHTIKEKEQDIWKAPPGIPNLETTLPLLLTNVNQNKMNFRDIKRLLCGNPANLFNIKNKGMIKEGMDADLVVVDMKKESIINPDDFKSKAKYSPFTGWKVKGMPVMTMLRGKVVMDEGEVYENKVMFVY